MVRAWATGPEVRRVATASGAMLYDTSRASNLRAEWFDPFYWRNRQAVVGEAPGRGSTVFVREQDHELALRHYHRGGLIAKIAADRYVWRSEAATRPFAEWFLSYHLARAGLPVAVPIAARYVREGFAYRGDLITERLRDTTSLAASLALGPLPLITWIAIGRCIRRFHELGVCHADLNAHNILLGTSDAVHVIDFDRGSLRKPGLWCDANLVRLRRSLDKITDTLPAGRFGDEDWHSLLAGYRDVPSSTTMSA